MKYTRSKLLAFLLGGVINTQAVAQDEQPYTQWCQQAPYCTFTFAGQSYPYPIGWRIISQPYFYETAAGVRSDNLTYQGERKTDHMKAYVNERQMMQSDCTDGTPNRVCYLQDDDDGSTSFHPISQYERSIWLGHPVADNGYLDNTWQWLDTPVEVVLTIPDDDLNDDTQMIVNGQAAQFEIDKANSQHYGGQQWFRPKNKQVHFTTQVADQYQIKLGQDLVGEAPPEWTNIITVRPSPGKQCFILSSAQNNNNQHPIEATPCTDNAALPDHSAGNSTANPFDEPVHGWNEVNTSPINLSIEEAANNHEKWVKDPMMVALYAIDDQASSVIIQQEGGGEGAEKVTIDAIYDGYMDDSISASRYQLTLLYLGRIDGWLIETFRTAQRCVRGDTDGFIATSCP